MLAKPRLERIIFATEFLASSRSGREAGVGVFRAFKAPIVMLNCLELSYIASELERARC